MFLKNVPCIFYMVMIVHRDLEMDASRQVQHIFHKILTISYSH